MGREDASTEQDIGACAPVSGFLWDTDSSRGKPREANGKKAFLVFLW